MDMYHETNQFESSTPLREYQLGCNRESFTLFLIRVTESAYQREVTLFWRKSQQYYFSTFCLESIHPSILCHTKKKREKIYNKYPSFGSDSKVFSWYPRCGNPIKDNSSYLLNSDLDQDLIQNSLRTINKIIRKQ